MKKYILILSIIIISLFITGCNKTPKKITLEEKYYNKGEFIPTTPEEINTMLKNKESFIIYTYNYYCSFSIPVEEIFKVYIEQNNISFLSIPFPDFKDTTLSSKISYAPSVIIIDKGKIVDYLNAESDEDLDKYQDPNAFTTWLNEYINLKN